MQFIPLNNTRLTKHLQNVIDGLFVSPKIKQILSKVKKFNDNLLPNSNPVSEDYLFEAFKQKISDYGFPRSCKGTGMGKNVMDFGYEEFLETQKKISKVGMFLGTPNNALTMFYPDNGFIGWHHNGNAPGYNILLTYSQDGNGCFKYWDYNKKEVVVHKDPIGWSVKVGYYPNERTETDRVFWHAAETSKARLSIAWVMNQRDMWVNMINDISCNQYDPQVLNQFQMSNAA